jgi:polyisoprenoid-binding protein YceI
MTNLLRCRFSLNHFLLTAMLALIVLLMLSALPQHASPQKPPSEIVLELDPAQSKVNWTLGASLHTVRGTFGMKKGTVRLDPASGIISGELVVDATTGNSGDDSRDKKMHKDVLDSGRYTEIVFHPDRAVGTVAPQGKFGVQVHGLMELHGSAHEITVPIEAEFAGNQWTCNAKFSVPFIDWGLKNPSNFFLKVEHTVQIELELKGHLQSPVAP